jgi:putative oxidoreductase
MDIKLSSTFNRFYEIWLRTLDQLKHVFLLVVRLYWGYQFMFAGLGKFKNFEKTVGFFTNLGIPLPEINAGIASTTEFAGGICLLLGLASRIVTVPLAFTMCIAYATAHSEELSNIYADTDKFLAAPPFLFLFVSLIVLLFGPGKYALDTFFKRVSN